MFTFWLILIQLSQFVLAGLFIGLAKAEREDGQSMAAAVNLTCGVALLVLACLPFLNLLEAS